MFGHEAISGYIRLQWLSHLVHVVLILQTCIILPNLKTSEANFFY